MTSPRRFRRLHDWSFWHYHVTGWTLFAVVEIGVNIGPAGLDWRVTSTLFFQSLAGCLLTLLLRRYFRSIPLHSARPLALVAQIFGASIVITFMWSYCWLGIEYLHFGAKVLLYASNVSRAFQIIVLAFPTYLAWNALYFGIKYWHAWGAERTRAEIATESAHQAQWQTLRYQMNPHFLFNSLNAVRALIDENPTAARQMVTDLSEFLRYSLVGRDHTSVPLREEIEAVRLYLSIEQQRYEDKLRTSIQTDKAAMRTAVPAFTVQPIVEYALRTGLQSGPLPLVLDVSAREEDGTLRISVRRNGTVPVPPADPSTDESPLPHERLEQRIADAFNGRATFSVGTFEDRVLFDLTIPSSNGEGNDGTDPRADR